MNAVSNRCALVWLLTLGCTAEPEPPYVPPPPPPQPPPIVEPIPFERDLATSEETADAVAEDVTHPLCRALRARERFGVARVIAKRATARCVGPWHDAGRSDLVSVRRAAPTEAACDPVDAMQRLAEGLAVVERCKLGILRFKLAAPRHDIAVATFLLELVGSDGGRRVVRRGEIRAALTKTEAAWVASALEIGDLEEVSGEPRFHDVSGQVGVGLHRAALTETALRYHGDTLRLETSGGVAVIDLDRDGADDLLAWNRLRTSQAFFNDGAGGFRRVHDPLPKTDVGSFLLAADLDGDGTRELVSSELVRCRGGRARFGLFRAEGERFTPLRGPEFAQDCHQSPMVVYEHIAVADVDRDGRLDLFFSGYRGPHSKKAKSHNMFQADDGQPNLLFRQTGPLEFAPAVLSERAFSYAAAFVDVDEDGDEDLFVANDYGTNELWRNDGEGHFTEATGHPLTANGQSMGVTVADFDDDLDLDLYVSNMFSKAGHRVVPLVEGAVRTDTYAALSLLARGNTLFRRDGPDRYSEVAADLAMTRAGWAWGQAFFDVDGDGDRELYVVNGMTSHSDPRAPDF